MPSRLVTKHRNAALVKKFGKSGTDTGSTEVQVALATARINELNGHFKTAPKDFHSNRGLLALVGKRKRLLTYLKNTDQARYTKLIDALELRK